MRTPARRFSAYTDAPVKCKNPLRFLVLDGYSKAGRDELEAGGASTAGILYRRMLHKASPWGAVSDIVYPCDADVEKLDVEHYDGIAWTGCSLCIYSNAALVLKQIGLAKRLYATGIPSFGSCWALQLSATAAGGKCGLNPNGREMGIGRKIILTPEGRGHPMYEGKPSVFDAFMSHLDEVTTVPVGGTLLASNFHTRVQALDVTHNGGSFWSVQYHPEYDLHELARLTYCRINKLVELGFFQNRTAGEEYVNDLETLHQDASRKDLAWKLGIDADVMNEDVRHVEVRNWIKKKVDPFRRLKQDRV